MNDLLTHVIDSHGGLDRWSQVTTLTVDLAVGGPFWGLKGWPDALVKETLRLDTRREHIELTPFLAPDRTSVVDTAPDRVTINAADGSVVEHRDQPRGSMVGVDPNRPWDAAQLAYFISYAMWNYLTEPFLFTYPGVSAHEIEPWQENGETWRRLAVTFPKTIATHNPDQVFYYDARGMQRRMDYAPEVNGNALVAHYTNEPRTFGAITFPTRRRIYRRNPDQTADQSLATITLDIHDISVS